MAQLITVLGYIVGVVSHKLALSSAGKVLLFEPDLVDVFRVQVWGTGLGVVGHASSCLSSLAES